MLRRHVQRIGYSSSANDRTDVNSDALALPPNFDSTSLDSQIDPLADQMVGC